MKDYKQLTREQQEVILETYQRLLSTRQVAKQLGVNIQQVRHLLKRRGIPLSNGRGVCYQNIELVRQWARESLFLSEIARRLGTNHHTVAAFLRLHSIPYTPPGAHGANNSHWKGGRMLDKTGYVLLKMPEHHLANRHGYVREHRLVMEQILGRRLQPGEVVHHKDGDKQNNSPDNLEIFGSNSGHLATTLKGKVPRWTEDGKRRILEGHPSVAKSRKTSNPEA